MGSAWRYSIDPAEFAALRRLIDIGGAQRVGLDAGLVEQAEPSRRTGSENEFGTAKHAGFVAEKGFGGGARGTYRKAIHSTTGEQVVERITNLPSSLPSAQLRTGAGTHNHRPLSGK
jgi:hypothetical protein